MKKNSEISFYVDTLIVETLLSDEHFSKTAQSGGSLSQLIEIVKNYFNNKIDPNNKAGSLLSMLTPGLILSGFGFGKFSILLSLATSAFQIDIASILGSIFSKIKGLISGDKQISSDEINNTVSSSFKEAETPITENEADNIFNFLQSKQSVSKRLRDAQLLKLAMNHYNISKNAGKPLLSQINMTKSTTVNVLITVIGWIFKVALASAGLLIAGDVVNKFLGRPNALSGTVEKGRPVSTESAISTPTSKQTKFKVKSSYKDRINNIGEDVWMESRLNNNSSIGDMLVDFAQEVYSGLDDKENLIRSAPGFEVIKNRISIYNRYSPGGPVIFIPKYFTSKKQIVDMLIDDVAEQVE